MRMFIFLAALILSGAAYAEPDCSNYGGTTLAGCSVPDYSVDRTQDQDAEDRNNGTEEVLGA